MTAGPRGTEFSVKQHLDTRETTPPGAITGVLAQCLTAVLAGLSLNPWLRVMHRLHSGRRTNLQVNGAGFRHPQARRSPCA